MLSPGMFGSMQRPVLEEGQAGEFVTSFKSSAALDNGQSQFILASKLIAKWWAHESKGFPVEMRMASSLFFLMVGPSPAGALVLDLLLPVQKHAWLNLGGVYSPHSCRLFIELTGCQAVLQLDTYGPKRGNLQWAQYFTTKITESLLLRYYLRLWGLQVRNNTSEN